MKIKVYHSKAKEYNEHIFSNYGYLHLIKRNIDPIFYFYYTIISLNLAKSEMFSNP